MVKNSAGVLPRIQAVRRWGMLMPGSEARFDDAYSVLSEAELRQLACLARIHWLVATGRDAPGGPSAQEAARIEAAFAERGLDAKWLLSQREAVRENRVKGSFNPAVEGQRAELKGFVLPLDWNQERRFTRFLLTPALGECSHEPPPPHHQVVYVESPRPIELEPREVGELCLSVVGSLRFAASSHQAFLVDGMMRVDASYLIEPIDIEPTCPMWPLNNTV